MSPVDGSEYRKVDFASYFLIAWKYRWWIVVPTLAAAALALAVSFVLPRVYRVQAIVSPSRFLTQSENGDFRVVMVSSAKEVASQVGEGAFNALVGDELGIPPQDFPRILAETLRDTNLVSISVRTRDPEKGRQILASLFEHLKSDLDRKISVEINTLDAQVANILKKVRRLEIDIEGQEIAKAASRSDIAADKNRLVINERRVAGLLEDMETTKGRMAEMETLRQQAIKETAGTDQSLSLLIYANQTQSSINYINILAEQLRQAQMEAEDLKARIKKNERELLLIDNGIEEKRLAIEAKAENAKLVEDRKNRIDYAALAKKPTVSRKPVSPRLSRMAVIGALLGFFLSLGVAFFRETLEARKKESRPTA